MSVQEREEVQEVLFAEGVLMNTRWAVTLKSGKVLHITQTGATKNFIDMFVEAFKRTPNSAVTVFGDAGGVSMMALVTSEVAAIERL